MSKLVAVTGASGYIASVLVQGLIRKGYTVRGTVRSLEKAAHLVKLFPTLQLFQVIQSMHYKYYDFGSLYRLIYSKDLPLSVKRLRECLWPFTLLLPSKLLSKTRSAILLILL